MSNIDFVVRPVLSLAALLRADFDRLAAAAGMTTQGASALLELGAGDPMKMQLLAQRLACDAGNLSGTIDRLEAAGLVERIAHPSDRRARLLRPTARGRKAGERLVAALLQTDVHRRIEAMPVAERERLVALLRELLPVAAER